MLALTNPNVEGKGLMGSKGAVIVKRDGRIEPNHNPPKPGLKDLN